VRSHTAPGTRRLLRYLHNFRVARHPATTRDFSLLRDLRWGLRNCSGRIRYEVVTAKLFEVEEKQSFAPGGSQTSICGTVRLAPSTKIELGQTGRPRNRFQDS
jgi:hypothetical protein